MPTTITGTDGVSQVQAGAVESGDLAAGAIGSGDLPAGSVIQVVQETTSTSTDTTSNTYVDTGLSANITPISASSKILVNVSQSVQVQQNGSGVISMGIRLVKNGDVLVTYAGGDDLIRLSADSSGFLVLAGYVTPVYLDSANTTSAITYKTQFSLAQGGRSYVNLVPSSITLMEIAG